jgi:hypothetical protein
MRACASRPGPTCRLLSRISASRRNTRSSPRTKRAIWRREALQLEGLTGDHGGVIGALAAVGLRRSGRDGRIAWRPGLRETRGIVTGAHLLTHSGIDAIRQAQSGEPDAALQIQSDSSTKTFMAE